MVGYDGSEAAELALERTAELALALAAKVIVTSVETPVVTAAARTAGGYPLPVPIADSDLQEAEHAERERLLAFGRAQLERQGIIVEAAAPIGPPAEGIIEVAERNDADLIVVGTREPGSLDRFFRGSVSQDVARNAHCDVLVVHPEGRRRRMAE